jgi:hypothetical protein
MNDLEKLNLHIAAHWLGRLDAGQEAYLGYASTCVGQLAYSATELAERLNGLKQKQQDSLHVATLNRCYLRFARLAAKDAAAGRIDMLIRLDITLDQAELLRNLTDEELDRLAYGWGSPIIRFASHAFERGVVLHLKLASTTRQRSAARSREAEKSRESHSGGCQSQRPALGNCVSGACARPRHGRRKGQDHRALTDLPLSKIRRMHKVLRGTDPPPGPVMQGSAHFFAIPSKRTSAAWSIQCAIFLACYERVGKITKKPVQRGWRLLAAFTAYLSLTEKLYQTASIKRLDINQAYALLTHCGFMVQTGGVELQRKECPSCLISYPVVTTEPLDKQGCPVCAMNANNLRLTYQASRSGRGTSPSKT